VNNCCLVVDVLISKEKYDEEVILCGEESHELL
jgi:hypothetical protein